MEQHKYLFCLLIVYAFPSKKSVRVSFLYLKYMYWHKLRNAQQHYFNRFVTLLRYKKSKHKKHKHKHKKQKKADRRSEERDTDSVKKELVDDTNDTVKKEPADETYDSVRKEPADETED